MTTRVCSFCGAPDFGTPFCVSCQRPFDRSTSSRQAGAVGGFTEPVALDDTPLAGFFRRFFAFTLDWIILSILADIVRFAYRFGGGSQGDMISVDAAIVLSAILFFLYFTLLTAESGQTLGKMVMGVRVVRTDGTNLSHTRAFVRSFGYILSSAIFWLGFLWALWDRRKQTWHDKIADTMVVRT